MPTLVDKSIDGATPLIIKTNLKHYVKEAIAKGEEKWPGVKIGASVELDEEINLVVHVYPEVTEVH